MFSGGSSETTGAPASRVSPGRASTSATTPATGDVDRALGEAPARLRQRRVGGVDRRGLGDDLAPPGRAAPAPAAARPAAAAIFASAEARSAFSWSTSCAVAAPLRQQGLIALKIGLHLATRRDRVVEIGFGLRDLGRLARALEIGELVLGLLRQARGLVDGGAVGRVVLVEQRLAFDDMVAALDVDGGDEALLGRPDLDEIGFGVALPFLGSARAAAEVEPGRDRQRRHDQRQNEDSLVHGPLRPGSADRASIGPPAAARNQRRPSFLRRKAAAGS